MALAAATILQPCTWSPYSRSQILINWFSNRINERDRKMRPVSIWSVRRRFCQSLFFLWPVFFLLFFSFYYERSVEHCAFLMSTCILQGLTSESRPAFALPLRDGSALDVSTAFLKYSSSSFLASVAWHLSFYMCVNYYPTWSEQCCRNEWYVAIIGPQQRGPLFQGLSLFTYSSLYLEQQLWN